MTQLTCFKAYDIRGKVPEELNADIVYKIGRAYAEFFACQNVIIGHDARLESPGLSLALTNGLRDSGVDVIDIGLCGTEEVYFHTFNMMASGVDGGIMITASHNPKGYNGLKLVQKNAYPVSSNNGLKNIHDALVKNDFKKIINQGSVTKMTDKSAYIQHLLEYVDVENLRNLKIVANPGNGTAGLVLKELEKHLPFNVIYIQEIPDGTFPNGVPNPLLEENRKATTDAVIKHQADLGIAFDGDFDRCFFFDEKGHFIDGYYIVGLLAECFLKKFGPQKIIHDPRLTWNTIERVKKWGGEAVQCQTGHAFIKERMRQVDAIYGGEMSAHHYFKSFAYCDSGMIPWLLIAQLLTNKPLSSFVEESMEAYPCSGEKNYTVKDAPAVLSAIKDYYAQSAQHVDATDGYSFEFESWRFSVRSSNTEPLLRLNIESRTDKNLVLCKLKEIEYFISPFLIK